MCLVANQLISFKEFSDKLNMILKEFSLIFSEKDLKTVVSRVNKFLPSIFAAERANLWIVDSMTGSLYSFAEIIEKVHFVIATITVYLCLNKKIKNKIKIN